MALLLVICATIGYADMFLNFGFSDKLAYFKVLEHIFCYIILNYLVERLVSHIFCVFLLIILIK